MTTRIARHRSRWVAIVAGHADATDEEFELLDRALLHTGLVAGAIAAGLALAAIWEVIL